jgi:hypothetical protein
MAKNQVGLYLSIRLCARDSEAATVMVCLASQIWVNADTDLRDQQIVR